MPPVGSYWYSSYIGITPRQQLLLAEHHAARSSCIFSLFNTIAAAARRVALLNHSSCKQQSQELVLIDCSSCNHSIDLGVTQQQQRRLCSIKCSQHQELFKSLEQNGTSTEVHLVASRMPWCLLQLSEFQFDNAPARPTTYYSIGMLQDQPRVNVARQFLGRGSDSHGKWKW